MGEVSESMALDQVLQGSADSRPPLGGALARHLVVRNGAARGIGTWALAADILIAMAPYQLGGMPG
jgi:hypothetical protein